MPRYSQFLMRIGDLKTLHIEALVDEGDVGQCRVGMPVVVRFNAYPNQSFRAHVSYIAPETEDALAFRST